MKRDFLLGGTKLPTGGAVRGAGGAMSPPVFMLKEALAQASGMEEKFKDVQLNQVERKPAQSKCYNCGFAYPHLDRP